MNFEINKRGNLLLEHIGAVTEALRILPQIVVKKCAFDRCYIDAFHIEILNTLRQRFAPKKVDGSREE